MDNFMDKLAEKYNAQDMIRANSQAETAQMQSLQDQVEAYEAVLQEMRKLNYKNTELTEKMYALVDASIEKVRTLQIEANEGSVSTADVSREMRDAVDQAVSEAVRSMDETMARTLAESLQQPTDEMRQSNERMAEDVRNSLEAIRKDEAELLEAIRSAEAAAAGNRADILEELRAADSAIRDRLFEIQQSNTNTEESLGAVAAAVTALREDSLRTEAPQEVLERLQEVAGKLDRLKEEDLRTEAPQEVLERLQEVAEKLERLKEENLRTEAPQEILDRLQALSEQTAGIYERQLQPDEDSRAAAAKAEELLAAVQQQAQIAALTQETLSALTQSNVQTQDSLTELRTSVDGLREQSAGEQNGNAVLERLDGIREESRNTRDTLFVLRDAGEEQKNGIGELKEIGNDTKAALQDIFDSLQKARNGIAEIKAQQMLPQVRPGEDEMRQTLTELYSGHNEMMTGIRNLKGATDDTRNTVKSAIDTAVYGLKQDNKELVGILQRMNATLTSRNDEQDKAQREEEERARAEEDRRQLEERLKLTEDFMHKESVKVYRNVQAVINEKSDRQRESLDSGNQNLVNGMMKVKIWAIVSTIVGGANLVLMVLKIFGILN